MKNIYVIFSVFVGLVIIFVSFISPIISIVMGIFFVIAVLSLRYGIEILPLSMVFVLTLISSFNFLKTGYLIIAFFIFIYILYKLSTERSQQIIHSKKYLVFIFWIFIIVLQLSFIIIEDNTVEHIISLGFGIAMIWLLSRLVNSKKRLRMTYIYWGISVLLTICVAYWEVITGNTFLAITAYPDLNVATVGYFNPNNYSFLLGISLPVFFYWLQEKWFYKILGFFAIGSTLFLLYINNTRSVMIIAILAFIALVIKLFINRQRLIATMILFSIVIGIVINSDIVIELYNNISTLLNNNTDVSINSRKNLSLSALEIFKHYPLLGVGPGNSDYYMPIIGHKIHNFWLEILVNYGVFVFIALVLYFINSIYILLRKTPRNLKRLVSPLLWSIIIFIPTSLAPSSIFKFQILWFFLGIILCSLSIIKKENIRHYFIK